MSDLPRSRSEDRMTAERARAEPLTTGSSYYFAARYSRHPELRAYRAELEATVPGAAVTSRWIDPAPGDEDDCAPSALETDPASAWKHAEADCADIAAADTLVSFTGPVGRGGRHIEHGYAMALGKRIVIVGPRENVFHASPGVTAYATWPEFLDAERTARAIPRKEGR